MRILALIPGGIGDQILFFPTLKTLKDQYPKAVIDVIVEPRSKNAYRVCPYVKEVLVFDYKDKNGLADYLNLLGIIRDREYEVAVTLGRNWAVGFLLWLNGIPTRVGYQGPKSWFINNPVELKTEQYAAYMYHDLVHGLNISNPCPPLAINVPKEDIEWAESEQRRLDIKESGYILIHGGSSALAKTKGIDKIYPVPKWQRIVEDVQRKQPNLPIVLLNGPDDQEWTAEMLQLCNNLKVISPPDIGKLSAFIAGANLMLCTDSAPMHLSVAVGTYTIALFGPTQADKLLPPKSDRFIGIQSLSKNIADIPTEKILEKMWQG
ncbi:glycosyltransferase family 9 protein [Cyanobacterium stanieri LEGE 03274]|uniref:Glycosyltransferase family 9 protein n=1 Tax=Cyanobacterium stanieri LEGE 03274 TaxID=1828756 RepID=A0ABR9V2I0_9CHRO|nr:glycosyltransferase family 9 protein [Cyanobacterium stanieri]MBE9222092.1 glycosyltransferase family 9 protein [Cyanobacterium stanieri LEGE 03274]